MTAPGGSPAPTGAGGRGGRSGVALVIAVAVALVLALVVIGSFSANTRTTIPYDPTSTGPDGVKALTQLAGAFGAEVSDPDRFPPEADVAVLFEDVVPPDEVEHVRQWVRQGHTLVVTDPLSELTPGAVLSGSGFGANPSSRLPRGDCTVGALRGVGEVELGDSVTASFLFRDTGSAPVCFTSEDGAFVTVNALGRGRIVSLASGTPFQNRNLDEADNAVLAVDLLAPRPGTRVAILRDHAFGDGSARRDVSAGDALGRIITPALGLALLQLIVALGLYAWFRSRRVGRPILEPQPVQIAGSELVAAVGGLLQQKKDPAAAAAVMRADLRRSVALRFGLPFEAPVPVLADAIAARTPIDPAEAAMALTEYPVGSDAELLDLAHRIDAIRQEVLHEHAR